MLLSLLSCRKEEEPPSDAGVTGSRFADTNYEDDYHMAFFDPYSGFVYGNNFYYATLDCLIRSVPLPTGGKTETAVESKVVCSDALCKHGEFSGVGSQAAQGCPANMLDPQALLVLDSTESGGGQPIFYYSRCTVDLMAVENKWETGHTFELIRYDTAQSQTQCLVSVKYPIVQFMTYRDRIYFVTQTQSARFELHTILKSGGEVTTLSPGDGYINLVGANDEGIYVNDVKGNIYSLGLNFEDSELIYTLEEVHPTSTNRIAELGMFVEGEYLYFLGDFEVKVYPYDEQKPDWYKMLKHSIKRLKISDPVGSEELVASDVCYDAVYGVYKGVLYYGPFDVTVGIRTEQHQMDASNICVSGGTIKGVKLDSLETFDAITDSGYNYQFGPFYINDRCVIAVADPYRNGMGITVSTYGSWPTLLDFETGALYNVRTGERLYDGTIKD